MGTNEQACEKAYLQYEHLKILENLEIQNSTIRIDIRHVPPKVTQTPTTHNKTQERTQRTLRRHSARRDLFTHEAGTGENE